MIIEHHILSVNIIWSQMAPIKKQRVTICKFDSYSFSVELEVLSNDITY